MAFSLKVKLTGSGAFTDLSDFVYVGSSEEPLVTKRFSLNKPQAMVVQLKEASGFSAPQRHNEIRLDCSNYSPSGELFSGVIVNEPEKELFATEADGVTRYVMRLDCLSEEYLADLASPRHFHRLPFFQNMKVGEIIRALLDILTPGRFDVTGVIDGPIVPFYEASPGQVFSDVASELCDATGMHFWTRRGKAFLAYLNDFALGISANQTDADWDPANLTMSPRVSPIYNDVVGLAGEIPGAYVREYFAGDGLTMRFPLALPVHGVAAAGILQDDFSDSSLDSTIWLETDPTNAITEGPSLFLEGGQGFNQTKLVARSALELGGTLLLQHGAIRFSSAASGLLGGLYSSPTAITLANALLSFRAAPSGSNTLLSAIVSGAAPGGATTLLTTGGKDYILQTLVQAPERVRRTRSFPSLTNPTGFGGIDVASSLLATLRVLVVDQNDPEQPPTAQSLYTATLSGMPGYVTYAPFNMGSGDLAVNFLLVARPVDAVALTRTGATGTPRVLSLGREKEIDKDGAILGQETNELGLFGLVAPSAGDIIEVRYRSLALGRARVRDEASITDENSRTGDGGVRSFLLPELPVPPRDEAELEFAIKAFVDDHTDPTYEGSYTQQSIKTIPPREPLPGRFLTVAATGMYPQFSALVTNVTTRVLKESPTGSQYPTGFEHIDHDLQFGGLERLDLLIRRMVLEERGILGALGSTTVEDLVRFDDVGTNFAPPLADFNFTYSYNSTGYQVDFGTVAPTGAGGDAGHFEVRYSDEGWSLPQTPNLIAEPTGQFTTLLRTSRRQSYYAKGIKPVNLALHSSFEDATNWSGAGATLEQASGATDFFSCKFTGQGATLSGRFTNTDVQAVSGQTFGMGVTIRLSRALTGSEQIEFKIAGAGDKSPRITLGAAQTSGNFSQWTRYTVAPVTGITSSATYSIYMVTNSLPGSLNWWVDDIQIEKNPPSGGASTYFRTIDKPKGWASRHASLVQINFPLFPTPPASAGLDLTDRFHPIVELELPLDPRDCFGVEIRDDTYGNPVAVGVGTITTGQGSASSGTFSFNHANDADFLLVKFANQAGGSGARSIGSATFNGIALTKLRHDEISAMRAELWYLTGAPIGTFALTISVSAGTDSSAVRAAALSVSGVNLLSPIDVQGGVTATSTNPSGGVTTLNSGSLVLDALRRGSGNTAVPGPGQTRTFGASAGGEHGSREGPVTPAGFVAMTWTGTFSEAWAMSIVALRQAVGGGPLYSYSDLSLSVIPDDPALRYRHNNSLAKDRSIPMSGYTFNTLLEYSSALAIAVEMPAVVVSGLVLDEVEQAIKWTVNPTARFFETQVSSASGFSPLSASGVIEGAKFSISIEDTVQTRYFRVRGDDGLGYGAFASGSHTYVTSGVSGFNNTEHVESIGYPPDPFTDPTYGGSFSRYRRIFVHRAWDDYGRVS